MDIFNKHEIVKRRIVELALLIEKAGLTKYQLGVVNEMFDIAVNEHKKAVDLLEVSVTQNEILIDKPTIN